MVSLSWAIPVAIIAVYALDKFIFKNTLSIRWFYHRRMLRDPSMFTVNVLLCIHVTCCL